MSPLLFPRRTLQRYTPRLDIFVMYLVFCGTYCTVTLFSRHYTVDRRHFVDAIILQSITDPKTYLRILRTPILWVNLFLERVNSLFSPLCLFEDQSPVHWLFLIWWKLSAERKRSVRYPPWRDGVSITESYLIRRPFVSGPTDRRTRCSETWYTLDLVAWWSV